MEIHMRSVGIAAAAFAALMVMSAGMLAQTSRAKQLIAHRGASGYAPEHTVTAYRLAMVQGVDYVEPDLAVTKDGVLICLHDDTLERTSDVETVYPNRFAKESAGRSGGGGRRW